MKKWEARPGNRAKGNVGQRKFYRQNREKILAHAQEYGRQLKLQACQIVSHLEVPICANCGCDNLNLLEVAHVNHDGAEERGVAGWRRYGHGMYRAIIKGQRVINDLKVLCRLCNLKEMIEQNFDDKGFKVSYSK